MNGKIFDMMLKAWEVIENRWREYNQFRPHSSLGNRPTAGKAEVANAYHLLRAGHELVGLYASRLGLRCLFFF